MFFAYILVIALYFQFDFTKVIDLLNWTIIERYALLGPLIAQLFNTLLFLPGANWIYELDLG